MISIPIKELLRPIDSFDRVRLLLDHPINDKALESLKLLCRHLTLTDANIPYQPRWAHDLDILQPHARTFFLALHDALPAAASCQLYYVELARDYLTRFQIEARRMAHQFIGHATLRYSRGHVEAVKNGYYYNRRESSVSLAVYGDRPTKQFVPALGHPALHTELRFKSSEALARQGVRGPLDLAELDFDACWTQHLNFWSLPSQTEIGRAIGCKSDRDDSLQRAARNALSHPDLHLGGHTFALQKLVAQHHGVKGILRPLTFRQWQLLARDAALMPLRRGRG